MALFQAHYFSGNLLTPEIELGSLECGQELLPQTTEAIKINKQKS
jgi:hypothetical protein